MDVDGLGSCDKIIGGEEVGEKGSDSGVDEELVIDTRFSEEGVETRGGTAFKVISTKVLFILEEGVGCLFDFVHLFEGDGVGDDDVALGEEEGEAGLVFGVESGEGRWGGEGGYCITTLVKGFVNILSLFFVCFFLHVLLLFFSFSMRNCRRWT